MEEYKTLCFKTEKMAHKNKQEISIYFASRFIDSEILQGTDERGNIGFYITYTITK